MPANKITWKSLWPVFAALGLFIICTGGWYWAINLAQSAFVEQQRHRDVKPALTCDGEAWSGYPFRIQLDCPAPEIFLSRGRTRLTPNRLTAIVRAPNLKTVIVHLEGPTIIHNDRLASPAEIVHPNAMIRIMLGPGETVRAATDMSAVTVSQAGVQLVSAKTVSLRSRLDRGSQHNLNLALDLAGVVVRTQMQDEIVLDAIAAVVQADNIPREPVADATEWLKAAAAPATQFRIEKIQATYGDTELTAQGTVHIEATGFLDGSLTTRVIKLNGLLDRLRERQVITPKKAKAAGALLGLLDRGDGNSADLRFKNGELFWGPVKLGRHPALF